MKKLLTAAIVSSGAMLSMNAIAATSTTSMGVSATVQDSCNVSASALSFGSIDVLAGSNTDATTTIGVTCTSGTTYDVGLGAGANGDGTVTGRGMTDGATATLNYSLYSDSGRATNWGETVSSNTVSGTGNGSAQSLTVYGRVPSGQSSVPSGSYSDTVTVTVTY